MPSEMISAIVPLNAFEDNYIWAIPVRLNDSGGVAASTTAIIVVDPGDAAPVLRYLEDNGVQLAAILVTHHHGDHTAGIAELVAHRARGLVPVFGPARDNIAQVTHPVRGGERIELPEFGITFEVLDLPGHTRGHVAYYHRGLLFCGDVLFGAGCGRVFEGTMAEMQASLAKIAALPADTLIYCAHEYTQANLRFARAVEPDNTAIAARAKRVAQQRAAGLPSVPSTLTEERATNPFLRWDAAAVIAAATARRGSPPGNAIEVFTAIREWKNSF